MGHFPGLLRQGLQPERAFLENPMNTTTRPRPSRRGAAQLSLLLTVAFSLGLFVASDSASESACFLGSWLCDCCDAVVAFLQQLGRPAIWERLAGPR